MLKNLDEQALLPLETTLNSYHRSFYDEAKLNIV